MILHTIGHSNLSMPELLKALSDHGVFCVVDVRSSPHSYRFPHFDRPELAAALERVGISYRYMGDTLGGKPATGDDSRGWKQGKVDPHIVSSLSRSKRWAEGMEALKRLLREWNRQMQSVCLLCSEADPNKCHRSLIALELLPQLPHLTLNHITPKKQHRKEVSFQKTLL